MTEKTSVLIITRNRAKMLGNCLNSLLVQTRMPDEIIVVDNASTDNTKKVILSFKEKLRIRYVMENRVGIPYARNKGLQLATGSFLLMLDDDCEADKFWVERMEKAHQKYPNAWVILGRTFSLPKTRLYSLLAEFNRLLALKKFAKRKLPLRSFLSPDLREEMEVSNCDTKNFSIKTLYLKKYKLSFDEHFYRGSDTDLGKHILKKNGLMIFYPSATVGHWERSSLKKFLEQQWYIGRANARIGNKWKTPSFATNMPPRLKGTIDLLVFCKALNQWQNLPILMVLLYLDRLSRINGWFYEKMILSLEKRPK